MDPGEQPAVGVDPAGDVAAPDAFKNGRVHADDAAVRALDRGSAAAIEKRRLPGFQGVAAITGDGVIVYVSPSVDGRFGVDSATAVGRNFLEFVDAGDVGQAVDSFGGVLTKAGYHPALEISVGPADGERTSVDVVAENCLESDLGVVIMNLADSRERSMSTHLLNAQAEVVRQIALGGSLAAALELIAGFIATALPSFGAVAYVRDGDCYVGWGHGLAPNRVAEVERALMFDHRYNGALSISDAEPKVTVDLPGDPAWPQTARVVGESVRSVWSVPIRHDRGSPVAGCIEIYGPDAVMPRDDDWIVIQLVSRLAAIAVDHSIMQTQLAQDANVDPLTEIPNRRVITAQLAEAMLAGERPIVAFIDLDHLKVVNDGLGHEAGDQVIIAAARRLRDAVGRDGVVGRFGGDEFIIVVPERADGASELGNRCLAAFAEPVTVGGRAWQISASIGMVAVAGQTGPGEVLRDADAAMYEAKRAGRGRWVLFEPSTRESVVRRLRLEQQLRVAVELGEVDGWLQPIVRCSDWRLWGVEVLARWRPDGREWVPPSDFIALAEEIGLVDDIGMLMIDRALLARRLLVAQGYSDAIASVNLSPVQLQSDRLIERLRSLGTAVAQGLQLEMTEQRIVDDSAATLADLQRILGFGLGLAIDDFGTGYSSLGALHRIPAGTLKIDRSLVEQSDTDAGRAVVTAVVGVARAYEMATVAEGVETPEQAIRLRALGVDALQGYLFARPEPIDDLARRLARRPWCWDGDARDLMVDEHGRHMLQLRFPLGLPRA
jgi:diguanylate cyclase (GGDEF)-like protein